MPELAAGEPSAFDERLQLRPHDRRMDPLHVRPLGKSAIGASHEVLSANQRCKTNNALSDQFGMLDNVSDVTDHPWNENLVSR